MSLRGRAPPRLLPMRAEVRLGAPDPFHTGRERIRLRTLDSLDLAVTSPTLLKVDTQGYEHHVIDGAPDILSTIAVLECELSIARVYEGQAVLPEHDRPDIGPRLRTRRH